MGRVVAMGDVLWMEVGGRKALQEVKETLLNASLPNSTLAIVPTISKAECGSTLSIGLMLNQKADMPTLLPLAKLVGARG